MTTVVIIHKKLYQRLEIEQLISQLSFTGRIAALCMQVCTHPCCFHEFSDLYPTLHHPSTVTLLAHLTLLPPLMQKCNPAFF